MSGRVHLGSWWLAWGGLAAAALVLAGCGQRPADQSAEHGVRRDGPETTQLADGAAQPIRPPAKALPDDPVEPAPVGPPTIEPAPVGPPTIEPAPVGPPSAEPPGVDGLAPAVPAPPSARAFAGLDDTESDPKQHQVVRVYYGTDRGRELPATPGGWAVAWRCGLPAALLLTAMVLGWMAVRGNRRALFSLAAMVCVLLALWLAYGAAVWWLKAQFEAANWTVRYGNDRGAVETGVCEVSIPRDHRVGELETVSIFRLEVKQDPTKHVVLMKIDPLDAEPFFADMRRRVEASARKEALVFVHGYNTSFEHAVRRTAQLAYDLKFAGAPICYSWPSRGNTVQYTFDENNAEWTIPHLKQFLLDVRARSGAEAINLVAHSMGNRPLTRALQEIARELKQGDALFNEIVLAAPDIDAAVFREQIAPAIIGAGRRVTLYASSNDLALKASKEVHGFARAGDSGDGLVIVRGVDTVDVSGIDTSLVGHSYYADSRSILFDIYNIVQKGLPVEQRPLLAPQERKSLKYWVFEKRREADAEVDAPVGPSTTDGAPGDNPAEDEPPAPPIAP